MNYGQLLIRFAHSEDIPEIEALRIRAYGRARGFDLREIEPAARWRPTDKIGQVLVATHPRFGVVSTMTGFPVYTPDDFERYTNVRVGPHLEFPLFYFTHGGTHHRFLRRGLNTVLKLVFVDLLQGTDMRMAGHNVNAGTSRIDEQVRMGYRYYPVTRVVEAKSGYIHKTQLLSGLIHCSDFGNVVPRASERVRTAFFAIPRAPGIRERLGGFLVGSGKRLARNQL